jgi:outer membrane receptor protein involved in Fe transport
MHDFKVVVDRGCFYCAFKDQAPIRAFRLVLDVEDRLSRTRASKGAVLASPKFSLILTPKPGVEAFLDYGRGFHSNDARGVTATTNPATPMPRSEGYEAGLRLRELKGLTSELSVWSLDLSSELVWDGDAGTNSPSGPTRRRGVEFANWWTPTPWMTFDADYAWSRARFTDHPAAGDYVPEALQATFDGGLALHDLPPALQAFSLALRWRWFGPRALTQDNAVRSKATGLAYADIDVKLRPGVRLGISVFNLFDAAASDIDYYYRSRLAGEPLAGVDDIHTHPAEPRTVRVSVTFAR